MGELYVDQDIEAVKIVLKARDTSVSDKTVYLGTEYFAATDIESGSPEIWPVLAEAPEYNRAVGREAAIQFDIRINIYGKMSFERKGESFADLEKTYDFHNAQVTCLYWARPFGSKASGLPDETRQTLEVVDFSWREGILSLRARDTWFKNKELSKELEPTEVEAPGLSVDFGSEIGAWPFGRDVIVDGFPTESVLVAGWKYYIGFEATDHDILDVDEIFVKNSTPGLDVRQWFTLDTNHSPPIVGPLLTALGGYPSASTFSLSDDWRSQRWVHSSEDMLLVTAAYDIKSSGSPTSGTGELTISVYQAEFMSDSSRYVPKGPVLTQAQIDPAGLSVGETVIFEPALPLSKNIDYIYLLEWSNTDDKTNYPSATVKASTGVTHYAKDTTQRESGWTTQSNLDVGITLRSAKVGLIAHIEGTKFQFAEVNLSEAVQSGSYASGLDLAAPPDVKIRVDGLTDDGSGTYTGVVNGIIDIPADVIRFTLLEDEFGLDHGSGNVNGTDFTTARDKQSPENFLLTFSINERTTAQDLILDICRQSRTIILKDRDGKITLHMPQPIPSESNLDFNLTEDALKDELRILEQSQTGRNEVVNIMEQHYNLDELERPKDPAFIRRSNTSKFAGFEFITDTDSTDSDTVREGRAADSVAKFGSRPHTRDLNKVRLENHARKVVRYIFDRYHEPRDVLRFRVPRRTYYDTLDLFDNIRVAHSALASETGTTDNLKVHEGGTPITTYAEGVPIPTVLEGDLIGQVVGVAEQGPWLEVTIETVLPFEAI